MNQQLEDIYLFTQYVKRNYTKPIQSEDMTKQDWQRYIKKVKKDIANKRAIIKKLERLL